MRAWDSGAKRMLRRSPLNRRAFTVLEIIVSMILLGTVLAMVVPLTKRVVEQRRRAETRRVALLEVSNALERLIADRSGWPAAGDVRTLALPETFAAPLEDAKLVVAAVAVEGPADGFRFDAALTWTEPTGGRTAPLRLSAFVFESGDVAGGVP